MILKVDFKIYFFFLNKIRNFPVGGGKFKWWNSQAVGRNRSFKGKLPSEINSKTNTATN